MTFLTPEDQILVRSQTQNAKLYLSVYDPDVVFQARINDATITKGARTITYDNVARGAYTRVRAGMTLWVGSSSNLYSKGKVRIKSATPTTLEVAENSHILWEDNDVITAIDFFELNAVFPRMIQDPNDETNTIWYKDYDIEYTNQNTILGSFICMGGHYAGFLDNNSHQVFYSATGTSNLTGEELSYHWNFQGASTTGSNDVTPGYIEYTQPGHYTTTLLVSGSTTGAVDVSYRHVSIYDRPGDGTNIPILKWELNSLTGDRNKGGYVGKIKIRQSISDSLIREGSLVVIFSENWYGGTLKAIGGNGLNRSNIFFVGYVIQGTITFNYRDSTVEFEVGSVTELMKRAEGFSISVRSSTDPAGEAASNDDYPSGWVLVKEMTVKRALYHYLRWHSTALNVCDFQYIGLDKNIQFFDADRESIWNAIHTGMDGTVLGNVVSDRQGKIFFETPIWSSEESSYFQTNMGITSQDWMDEPDLEEEFTAPVSYIELGGIAYSGAATGTYSAIISGAPGLSPNYRGSVDRRQGLALTSQDQLNTLNGDYYAHQNAQYPNALFSLRGYYPQYDIAPQEFVPVTIDQDETFRGITFEQKLFFPVSVNYSYLPNLEFLSTLIGLYEHTTGFAGDTISIPAEPPDEGEDGGSYSPPAFSIPPLPSFPSIDITITSPLTVQAPIDWVGTSGNPPQEYTGGSGWLIPPNETNYAYAKMAIPPGYSYVYFWAIMLDSTSNVSGDIAFSWTITFSSVRLDDASGNTDNVTSRDVESSTVQYYTLNQDGAIGTDYFDFTYQFPYPSNPIQISSLVDAWGSSGSLINDYGIMVNISLEFFRALSGDTYEHNMYLQGVGAYMF